MKTIDKLIEIKDYLNLGDGSGCFQLRDNTLMDIHKISCKDLFNGDYDTVRMFNLELSLFLMTYAADIKLICMNFPRNTVSQVNYFKHKKNSTRNTVYQEFLDDEIFRQEYIANSYNEQEFYLMHYAKNTEEYRKNLASINEKLGNYGFAEPLSKEKKLKILFKMNNKNTIVRGNEKEITDKELEKQESGLRKKGYNPLLIERIQPQGGISFKDEKYIKTGDGWECVLHIYDYPTSVDDFWLMDIADNKSIEAMVVIDISTDDPNEVSKNINKSFSEQSGRYDASKTHSEKLDAAKRLEELDRLDKEVRFLGEVVKLIQIRLFISAPTLSELEDKTKKIKDILDKRQFKASVFLNETKNEWMSMYIPYKKQQLAIKRYGQPIICKHIAYGNPFHFISLDDEQGFHLGDAVNCNGIINYDMWEKDALRLFYNAAVLGVMGSGKSTLLKKMVKMNAITGNYIRGFDPSGEFKPLVKILGGKYISLDGSDGKINHLQILRATDNDSQNFLRHIAKLQTIYKFLDPKVNNDVLNEYEKLLLQLYVEWGFVNERGEPIVNNLTAMPADKYPTYSDLNNMLNRIIKNASAPEDAVQEALVIDKMKMISSIAAITEKLCTVYKEIFDGHSTIDDLVNEQIVYFDITNLSKMTSEVFDAQMFSALSLCIDNCVKVGNPMKSAWDKHEIEWKDIVRFLIIIDESHRLVNPNKLYAVDQLVQYSREARKFFGGILFATQTAREWVPEDASSEAIERIRILFELTQYKFIFRQDNSSKAALSKIFGGQLTDRQINDIPTLEMGRCMMSLSSKDTIDIKVVITDEEKELFSGGA